jgi:signal transduction histidine kinase
MVDKQTLKNIIQTAFPGLASEDADQMINAGRTKTFPPKTALCVEGAYESTFYIVLKGQVAVTKNFNDQEERFLKHLNPGDFFGEMAIIHDAPRAATVTTVTETTVMEISKETFTNFLESFNTVSIAVIREVSRRLRENDEMAIEDLRVKAKEVADAYQKLAEQDLARREFLTTIAHEFRTPLMAATGYLQIIRTGMLKGEGLQSAIETVERNMKEIITLTNNILFLQELDLILPEFRETDLGTVLASAVESQRNHAKRNRVGISLKIAPDLPIINADPPSLERAFVAILENAIKFSPNGGDVIVTVKQTDEFIQIIFRDFGVGIEEKDLPYIFDRFYHQEKIGNQLFRGIGLGLSITKEIIKQHKGNITVTSQPDDGSQFVIKLPI